MSADTANPPGVKGAGPLFSLFNKTLTELARMRTAIGGLVLAALFSTLGTWLPQGLAIQDYVANYGVLAAKILWFSGLTDVYRAWWYLGLWVFLITSVCACLVHNGPAIYWQFFLPKTLPLLSGRPLLEQVTPAQLAACGLREVGALEGKQIWERGRLSRLGYFGVHAGVVGVAVAGLLTGLVGWRGTLNIREGDSDHVALVWHGRTATPEFLPFRVKNQSFNIDFYASGMPQKFYSTLALCRQPQACVTKEVSVNHPVSYGGYTFYQASFGDGGSAISGSGLDIATGKLTPFQAKVYETSVLADGTKIKIIDFRPFTVETIKGEKPTDVGPSVDYLVQPPAAEAHQLRAYLNHPEIIGVAEGANGGPVNYRPVFLGLSLKEKTLWPVVGDLVAQPDLFRARMRPVLAKITDEQQRVATGLAVMQAVKTLRELGLTQLVRLDDFTLRRYTGLQVAYDPGAMLFWIFAVVLALGTLLMLGRRLVRVYYDPATGQAWLSGISAADLREEIEGLEDKSLKIT